MTFLGLIIMYIFAKGCLNIVRKGVMSRTDPMKGGPPPRQNPRLTVSAPRKAAF